MTRDDTSPPEADFHDELLAGLREFLAENPAELFSDASVEESVEGSRAGVLVEGRRPGSLVIEVTRDTVDPRTRGVVVRARQHARDLGTDCFATCNSNDLFLFDRTDEVELADADYYYLDLRARPISGSVPSILEAVEHRYRRGRLPDQTRGEKLAGTLRGFHSSTWPTFVDVAIDAYGTDQGFTDAFDDWVVENDYRDRDQREQFEIAAKRYAYLLTNRVLLHEVVRRRPGYGDGEEPITSESGSSLERLGRTGASRALALRRPEAHFRSPVQNGVTEGDARTIRTTDSELFDSFPHVEATRRRVFQLARNLESEPIEEIDQDLLGDVYEALIPEDERKALGQFYTHPAIAETLVRWALRPDRGASGSSNGDEIPRVLDPASGSGTFVVEAYQQLAGRFPEASHRELVDHVIAVEVNRFPLHLTALNLALQRITEPLGRVHAFHSSFFDLDPSTDLPVDARTDGPRDGEYGREIGPVDAVVGNPPYIGASDLHPDKEHFRSHLREFGTENAEPYEDGENSIGANADAYVYFVTHATRFLREGGRLGFIVPTKWMMSRYGEQFQQFLYDHYEIRAVVGFDARAFEDALVDTALVLLEKRSDEAERRRNVVEFVQLHGTVSPGNLLESIDHDYEVPDDELTITSTASSRTVGVRQSYLEDETEHGKIAHYLVAPEDLIELVESPALVGLGEMAHVRRGAMTGSTSFFFPDGEDVEAYGIEDEFLRPALKSMRGYDTIDYEEADVDRWFVDVHQYVEEVRGRPGNLLADESLEEKVKSALEDDGYTGLLSWIRRAESEGEHLGTTCQNREVWFDFGEPPRPEILLQKLLRERLFGIYNGVGAVPSNAVDCVDVHPDVDSKALFGVLNSSITQAIMEVWGRNEAGMLQLMTYETKSLPVPDVRSMSEGERGEIRDVVDDILERGESELSEEHRDRLDAAVLQALDQSVATSVERVQEIRRFMLDRRVESGETIQVLMGESDVYDETGTRSVSQERDGVGE